MVPNRLQAGVPVAARCCGCARSFVLLLAMLLVSACSTLPTGPYRDVGELPPLQWQGETTPVAAVADRVRDPELLGVDDEMREFVERYTGSIRHKRQRLRMLHAAIKGPATFGVQYDPEAGGGAREVFHRGTANCLSYASLFIALAREAGLDASYQWLEVRPSWTRQGERVMVNLHVNASVDTGRTERYMVDIDPLPSRDIAGTRDISDSEAVALHHGNFAMQALAAGDVLTAWLHTVRALELGPAQAHMWVNLGAIYRFAGQHRAAENSYLYALDLDPYEHSAMNNLVVLYEIEGRLDERDHWDRRVSSYRDANPYYHAWLADEAVEVGDWAEARDSYARALELAPENARLMYSLGLAYRELGNKRLARRYLEQAIEFATLFSEREEFRVALRSLSEGS
ncbi:MAG: tetratricopeptide repeat protein [Halioglobus sp.]|nr:tetratricopeptide repeat protein [Halioglobus sp.]